MKKDLGVWIISPSSYDDGGYLFQFFRLLMIPPIFGVLKSLIWQAAARASIALDIFCVNERTEVGDAYIQRIIANPDYVRKLILLSAKTFELPRAIDLARQFKRAGLDVVIGGIILGALFSLVASIIIKSLGYADWVFSVPLMSIILAVSVAAAVGLIFGLYPARRAGRLDPIEALRYE